MSEEAELAAIWREFKPQTLARIDVIRDAARASLGAPLGSPRREAARLEAHTLAGSAAIFGMREGARLAREIETLLQAPAPLSEEDLDRIDSLAAALSAALSA